MNDSLEHFRHILDSIEKDGLSKKETKISSAQNIKITIENNKDVLNFCSNNYLGLSNNQILINAAKEALDKYGFGMASVRFICGTQEIHKELEVKISSFFGTDDTILYSSCFDANAGLFETILGPDDAIISDSLNHASIIDGIRLCKAKRLRFKHSDMKDLEEQLISVKESKIKMIATDGVFSMDGHIAKLDKIASLAQKYDAMLMVDDSHATGFIGKTGRGSAEYHSVMDKVDVWTSTLGKALGGASGGFTTGSKELIGLLRQRSRPYLFSNTVSPSIVAAGIKVFEIINNESELKNKLNENTLYFRTQMKKIGFNIIEGTHPIVPIMLNNASKAKKVATEMLLEGIYVVGFYYPVVPKGKARIRIQISAAMEKDHLDKALHSFEKVGKKFNLI
ncbi:MAG: glycine C-acetyltransferase [Candidatus Marinimicrobia bacterium]|nr:glycine C-acetyltransferase [Candidatus Neomarinimicrobiota bacterium]